MFIEIITTGGELLIDQVIDADSTQMGRELNKIGIEVIHVVFVHDRAEEITEAADASMRRADIVLVIDSLSPTKDDITRQTLCRYFGTRLIFSEAVFENVKRVLVGRIPMDASDKGQAVVPESCTVVNNRVGSASVSWSEKDGKVLVLMSSVPQEMTTVMSEEVIPRLYTKSRTDVIAYRTSTVQNYPGSMLVKKPGVWEVALPSCIKLAHLPKPGLTHLRLTGRGQGHQEVETCLNVESAKLEAILGEDILDEEDTSVEILIGEFLKKKKLTLSTAEDCAGGNTAARVTSVAGSPECFKGSVVVHSNEAETKLLGVSMKTPEKKDAVNEETVIEMVKGAMEALETDYAVATSGIAGPGGDTKQKPVGTV